MDRDKERQTIETAQAQEWAKRHMEHYEPRWSRSRLFAFCIAAMMACTSCWLAWMELAK